jgi:Zn-dependent protease with chaperone function
MPRTGRRVRGFAGALVTALVLTGWPAPPTAAARIVSRSAEISVGRETASLVEQYFTVDTDPVAVARVRGIGRRLVGAARDAEYPFEFHVVESPEVNAFALPGGFIYVFRGLLQLSPTDDALAFVLAHEIAHVTRRHAARQFEKNLLLAAAITGILSGTGAPRGVNGAASLAQEIASLSFTRSDEAEADEEGMALFTAAGYNPRAAVDAMELVKRAGGDGRSVPALLRSHPLPDSRIKKLRELADARIAARLAQRDAAPLPPPPALPANRRLAGLDAVEVAPCPWQPLQPGARWLYRTQGTLGETSMSVRVLEALVAEPEGVVRVEYDLGRGVRALRWLAPAGDRFLSRSEADPDPTRWRLEAVFAPGESGAVGDERLRVAGSEKVTVPAGEYEAVKVERIAADGAVVATLWFAKGVGLVRRLSAAGAQELTSYRPGR